MLTNHVMQIGAAMRPRGFAIREQEIKGAEFTNAWREFFECVGEFMH